jgi:hypothetical protein
MPVYKLDQNRVPDFWDLIKPGLILGKNITGVEGDWDFANKVLEQALAGACNIWIGFEPGEVTGEKYIGFLITFIAVDRFNTSRDLVIYFAYSYRIANEAFRVELITSLLKYAKAKDCQRIVAYTEDESRGKLIEGFLGQHVNKRMMYYVKTGDF